MIKRDCCHHGCCHHCRLEDQAVKPPMQLTSQRLWLCYSRFSSWKVQIIIPGTVSVIGWGPRLHCCLSPGLWLAENVSRWSTSLPISQIYFHSSLFSLWKSEVKAGWPLAIPGQLQKKAGGGHLNHLQQGVRCLHLEVDVLLHKVHPNQLWLGLKKSRNNGVLKLFRPAHLISITSYTARSHGVHVAAKLAASIQYSQL